MSVPHREGTGTLGQWGGICCLAVSVQLLLSSCLRVALLVGLCPRSPMTATVWPHMEL